MIDPSRDPVGLAAGRASIVRQAAWLPLALGLALTGCGKSPGDPAPDMSTIRGEPIERIENPAPTERLESSIESGVTERSDGSDDGWVEDEDGLIQVGFDRLAGFDYVVKDEAGSAAETGDASQIPRLIRELDGREVGVQGFMLPVRMDGGWVREFLLMRDQSMCCFGVIPEINEWVTVTMSGRGVRAMLDQPVTVFGTLRVGEVYQHGVLAGIYWMEGEELAGALDL
jgi:hypothetical protein